MEAIAWPMGYSGRRGPLGLWQAMANGAIAWQAMAHGELWQVMGYGGYGRRWPMGATAWQTMANGAIAWLAMGYGELWQAMDNAPFDNVAAGGMFTHRPRNCWEEVLRSAATIGPPQTPSASTDTTMDP